jgi:uncharacterized membrane protein
VTGRKIGAGFGLSLVVIAAMAGMSLWASARLPAGTRIPVQFGEVGGGAATRFQILYLVPLIGLGAAAVFAVLPRFESTRVGLMGRTYVAMWMVLMLLLGVVHAVMLFSGLGREVNTTTIVLVLVGVLFVVVGTFLPRLKRNTSMGLRTPWTMASDLSWSRTHRFAGRLFVVLGVVMMLGVFIDNTSIMMWIVVAGSIGTFFVSLVYSYVVWRSEQRG